MPTLMPISFAITLQADLEPTTLFLEVILRKEFHAIGDLRSQASLPQNGGATPICGESLARSCCWSVRRAARLVNRERISQKHQTHPGQMKSSLFVMLIIFFSIGGKLCIARLFPDVFVSRFYGKTFEEWEYDKPWMPKGPSNR